MVGDWLAASGLRKSGNLSLGGYNAINLHVCRLSEPNTANFAELRQRLLILSLKARPALRCFFRLPVRNVIFKNLDIELLTCNDPFDQIPNRKDPI